MSGEKGLNAPCCGRPWADHADHRCPTPTSVPSEVAETTAGEREVEALADLSAIIRDFLADEGVTHAGYCATALTHRMAPLLDRVRREEGERIAQAITREADKRDPTGKKFADQSQADIRAGYVNGLDRAATIARAASVGRGEGL